MKLFLESCADTPSEISNMIESSKDLGEVLATFNAEDKTLSPIEAAALSVTMQQIDVGNSSSLSHEAHTVSSKYFGVIAHEALKDGIRNAWEKFLAMVKNINKRVLEALSNIAKRLRGLFKRKAGEQNSKFERNEQEEKEASPKEGLQDDKFVPPKSYTMSKCYIDMGNEASAESFISRLVYSRKLISAADIIVAQHGGLASSFFRAAENSQDNQQWEDFVTTRSQSVLDKLVDDLGANINNGVATVSISETTRITMILDDLSSFPYLLADKEPKVDLVLPENKEQFAKDINRLANNLLNPILSAIDESRKILGERDYKELAKAKDDVVRERLMTLGRLVTRRSLFIKDIISLVTATQDIAFGIHADIDVSRNG